MVHRFRDRKTIFPSRSRQSLFSCLRIKSSNRFLSSHCTQQAVVYSVGSNRHWALYSVSSRNWSTSNWSAPTTPMSRWLELSRENSCTTPSSASCSSPFSSCLDFNGSRFITDLKICGAKLGIPVKRTVSPSVIASPILNVPVSWSPTISPG